MGRLDGKVAFVTGGGSGIGRGCCLRFAEEGADVVVADFDPRGGQETVRLVEGLGRKAVFTPVDVSREPQVIDAVEQGVRALGKIDLCLAAAGVAQGGPGRSVDMNTPIQEQFVVRKPTAHWQRVLDVNLTGLMYTDRAVARQMIARGGGGKIVNIASGAAKIPIPGAADYCVSKTGVWMLTKVLARELARHQIRVNAIGPGFIETAMTAPVKQDGERWERMATASPLARIGQPVDIANAALFLVSDESDFMTGQILHPDGGLFTG